MRRPIPSFSRFGFALLGVLCLCGAAFAQAEAPKAEGVKKDAPKAPVPAPAPAGQPTAGAPKAEAPKAPEAQKSVTNPKAVEVVNKYIEALGGHKILDAVVDRTQKFRNTKHAAGGDTVAVLNQFLRKGNKVREEWNIEGVEIKNNPLAFTQVYNGTDGWILMFGAVSPLEGRTLSLFVWDKFLDDQFCHWNEDGYTLDFVGPGMVDNEACDVIEMMDFGGVRKERYSFSKASGLLLKKEWKEPGQNGLSKKEIFYKKYMSLPFSDGSKSEVKFARLHEVYEDGDLDTSRDFTEMKVNSGLKDSIFERPEGEEFKGGIGQGGLPPPAFRTPATKAASTTPGVTAPQGGHPTVPPALTPPPAPPKAPAPVPQPPAPQPVK